MSITLDIKYSRYRRLLISNILNRTTIDRRLFSILNIRYPSTLRFDVDYTRHQIFSISKYIDVEHMISIQTLTSRIFDVERNRHQTSIYFDSNN